MLRAKRPFDEKPADQCLTCGTPIAGGEFCLSCVPLSLNEGPTAWVNHRWFSGPVAEMRKRRLRRTEDLQRGFAGFLAVAALLAVVTFAKPISVPQTGPESVVAVRHAAKMPWKVALNATNIS